jgi:sucrose phosphorylase
MIDAVINHISRESEWFQGYLNSDPKYQDYFITVDSSWDLSKVVRPRTSPLLTEVETVNGPKKVWTTFSADQIDLNYANPAVLLEILDLLLFYLDQGVSIIRLDAIAYLWKESGTTCIHLPQTHRVVKLMRLVMEAAKPAAVLITETNVPHMENISYFGSYDYALKRTDEAHMVYQFPLAPLVLHTLVSGSAKRLMDWVEGLGSTGIFFNFIASHDGIGMLPAHGILTDEEIKDVIDQVSQHGGLLSHRSNPDGSMTVYELNTTLFDALNDPNNPDPTNDINRFLASQVIIMSLAGVPGIYYHSLFGSRNSLANVQKTGRARSINRKKFVLKELERRLKDPKNNIGKIFYQLRELLSIRTQQIAFSPYGEQHTLKIDDRLFGLVRHGPNDGSGILVLINISSEQFDVTINLANSIFKNLQEMDDLINGGSYAMFDGKLRVTFGPYQSMWLK